MIENYTTLNDKILIKVNTSEERTAGGIFMPISENDNVRTAEVLAVGCGRVTADGKFIDLQVQQGDIIKFNAFAGIEIEKDIRVIKEEDILIKIK